MRRQSRFGKPLPYVRQDRQEQRLELLDPSRGLHAGVPAQSLPPGFTPEAENLMVSEGYLTPRSGLSAHAGSLGTTPLGAFRAFDSEGNEHAIACSQNSVFVVGYSNSTWKEIAYQKPDSSATNALSGNERDYWQGASVYDPETNEAIAVFVNGVDLPKVLQLGASIATYSDLTAFASFGSSAKAVCAFDNRLVFANTKEIFGNKLPQRVVWSPRGLPKSNSILAGAGFEDLMDFNGEILALVPEKDGVLLFGSQEIWRGRRRSDAFAFTWYPVSREIGCPYPRTIARTPAGTLFLGRDLEVYVVNGDSIVAAGPAEQGGTSRVKDWLRARMGSDVGRCHAVYSQNMRMYQLFYPSTSADHANAALWLSLDNGSWLPQGFGWEVSAALNLQEPGETGLTWDDFGEETWDSVSTGWNGFATSAGTQKTYALSSQGTSYVFDAASRESFDWKWRSQGLGLENSMRYDMLHEVWYESREASAATVYGSADLGASWDGGVAVHYSATTYGQGFAPVLVEGVAPQFEVRGSASSMKIGRMQAKLRSTGQFGGGF